VQQGANGEILVASRFQHERGNTQQVRDVRNRGSFAGLTGMFLGRKVEGFEKTRPELNPVPWGPSRFWLRSLELQAFGPYCFSLRRASK
jgi:hypothetical protein